MAVTVSFRLNRYNPPHLPRTLETDEDLELETVPRKGEELMLTGAHFLITRVMHRPGLPPLCIMSPVQLPEPVGLDLRDRQESAVG